MQPRLTSRLSSFLCITTALCAGLHSALPAAMKAPATVTFGPYQDPWPAALERWWDIDNHPYNDWITNGAPNGGFSYVANAHVTLTYDQAPGVPYFVGHIDGTGLKPNFAYQLKLLGKPVYGSRGMGKAASWVDFRGVVHRIAGTAVNGDDWANEQIGYAGRWWDDNNQAPGTNLDDLYYLDYYKNPATTGRPAPSAPAIHTLYGYQFMGSFVTNAKGEVHLDFDGHYAYHIDWASWQFGNRDVVHGTFPVRGWLTRSVPPYYYGYGPTAPSSTVTLYYELEGGRANPVHLAAGTYHCRFLLTEESFHNNLGATSGALGGYWKSVLATEDFNAGHPDTDPSNDVVFTIAAPAPSTQPTISSFTPARGQVGTSVLITGANLQWVQAVRFGTRAATFTRLSATQVRATVPSGAITGPITVISPTGSAVSATAFTLTPAIASLLPPIGAAGSHVRIIGANLDGTVAVRFNGIAARFAQATAAEVRAIVPAGATTGKITVTTRTGTATSVIAFRVTSAPPPPPP